MVITFPIGIGIIGGLFGLIAGLFGAAIGIVAGVFGAVFGMLGGVFGWAFNGHEPFFWNDKIVIAILLVVGILLISKKSR